MRTRSRPDKLRHPMWYGRWSAALKSPGDGLILAAMFQRKLCVRRTAALVLCVAGCWGGCDWKGRRATPPTGPETGVVWQFVPKSLRVYASSRFVHRDGQDYLDARVEVLDEMGDSTKAVGRFRIDLSQPGRGGADSGGQRLYTWPVSMYTLRDQRRYYDSVMRGYLFKLQLDRMPTHRDRAILEVSFEPHQGPRMTEKVVIDVSSSRPPTP